MGEQKQIRTVGEIVDALLKLNRELPVAFDPADGGYPPAVTTVTVEFLSGLPVAMLHWSNWCDLAQ